MFDFKFIAIVSVILTVMGILLIYLYKYTLVRWIIIILLLIAIFVKRKAIIGLIKALKKRDDDNE